MPLGAKDPGLLNHILPPSEDSKDFYYCPEYDQVMPFFDVVTNGTINNQIFWGLQWLNTQPFEDDIDQPGLDVIPDGAITFFKANDEELKFRVQINDLRLLEYHRYKYIFIKH